MSLKNLTSAIDISQLPFEQKKELQELLVNHGYDLKVDGIVGNKTLTAFNDFKKKNYLAYPGIIGPSTIEKLFDSSNVSNSNVINAESLNLIKEFEGLKTRAYLCPAGIPTIGYGSTFYPGGRKVKLLDVITEEEAEELLLDTLKIFANAVNSDVNVPLNENQFGALVSLCFNIGTGAFKNSTLVRVLNQGKYSEAANQFLRWNRGGGRVLAGLDRRRKRERELFLKIN